MEISPHLSTLRQERGGREEKEKTHKHSTAQKIKQTFFQQGRRMSFFRFLVHDDHHKKKEVTEGKVGIG